MAAATVVPSTVLIERLPVSLKSGTVKRIVKYIFQVTKVTDADWIVTATYFQSGNPIMYKGVTIDASGDGVAEETVGLTYTASGTKLTMSGGTTGTFTGEIWYEE